MNLKMYQTRASTGCELFKLNERFIIYNDLI